MATVYYCTHRDVKDVYPQLDSHDTKTPIYGWVTTGTASLYLARDSGLITVLFANGEDLGDPEANSGVVNVNGEWYYDSNLDTVYYFNSASDPNDLLMESGEDFTTLVTRFRGNASRYLESRLDKTLPREQFKDKDGNYDYMIVRTTSLITAVFLLQSTDQTSEVATSLWEEIDKNINELNAGNTKLSWMKTGDSSKGIIREVSVSGAIRLIKTRGNYSGAYDRIGVKITTAGVIGTAAYSIWLGDSDRLGAERMNQSLTANISGTIVNGQYQSCVNGLDILFSGDTGDSATLNDRWEVEVYGQYESIDGGNLTNIQAVRR